MRYPLGQALAMCLAMGMAACAPGTPSVEPGVGDMGALNPELAAALGQAIERVEAARDSASAWLELGELYAANGLGQAAERSYVQANRLRPGARTLYLLGLVRHNLGDQQGAAEAWEGARRSDPTYAPIHWRLGALELHAGRFDQARSAFERALELAPGDDAASMGLARCELASEQPERAAAILESLLERNKRHKRALNLMARVLERLGRPEEAERMARREQRAALAPERDDWYAEVLARRIGTPVVLEQALSLMERGMRSEAIALLEQQRTETPANLGMWNMLLRGLVLEKRFDEVLVSYGEAKDLIQEHHLLLISEGRAWIGKGHHERARQSFQRAVELAPGYGEGHAGLGEALLGLGQHGAAADALLRATELEQTGLRDWLALGLAEIKAERFDAAAKHAQEALLLYPLVPDLWALGAETAILAGQREQAERCLGMLAKRSAEHPKLGPLREQLEAMEHAQR